MQATDPDGGGPARTAGKKKHTVTGVIAVVSLLLACGLFGSSFLPEERDPRLADVRSWEQLADVAEKMAKSKYYAKVDASLCASLSYGRLEAVLGKLIAAPIADSGVDSRILWCDATFAGIARDGKAVPPMRMLMTFMIADQATSSPSPMVHEPRMGEKLAVPPALGVRVDDVRWSLREGRHEVLVIDGNATVGFMLTTHDDVKESGLDEAMVGPMGDFILAVMESLPKNQ